MITGEGNGSSFWGGVSTFNFWGKVGEERLQRNKEEQKIAKPKSRSKDKDSSDQQPGGMEGALGALGLLTGLRQTKKWLDKVFDAVTGFDDKLTNYFDRGSVDTTANLDELARKAAQRQADMDASRAMWESGEMDVRLKLKELYNNAKTELLNNFRDESYATTELRVEILRQVGYDTTEIERQLAFRRSNSNWKDLEANNPNAYRDWYAAQNPPSAGVAPSSSVPVTAGVAPAGGEVAVTPQQGGSENRFIYAPDDEPGAIVGAIEKMINWFKTGDALTDKQIADRELANRVFDKVLESAMEEFRLLDRTIGSLRISQQELANDVTYYQQWSHTGVWNEMRNAGYSEDRANRLITTSCFSISIYRYLKAIGANVEATYAEYFQRWTQSPRSTGMYADPDTGEWNGGQYVFEQYLVDNQALDEIDLRSGQEQDFLDLENSYNIAVVNINHAIGMHSLIMYRDERNVWRSSDHGIGPNGQGLTYQEILQFWTNQYGGRASFNSAWYAKRRR